MFRDDFGVNKTKGLLRKQISGKAIRGRLKGDKHGKLVSQFETHLERSGLISDDLYQYLKSENGLLRPGITQYIDS
jgi:hypothetical protein